MRTTDLNCDMDESFGPYKIGRDEEIIAYISPRLLRDRTLPRVKETRLGRVRLDQGLEFSRLIFRLRPPRGISLIRIGVLC
jgi:hypothetical protein